MLSKHVWSRSTLFFQFSKYGKAIAIWFIKMCLFIEQVSVHQPERRVDLQRAGSQDDPYHTIYVHIDTYCTLYTCTIHQDYMWTNAAHMLSTRRHAQNNLPTFWTTWCSEYGFVWNYTVITKKGSWLYYLFHVYLHLPYKSTICEYTIHGSYGYSKTSIYIDTFIKLQYFSYRNISPRYWGQSCKPSMVFTTWPGCGTWSSNNLLDALGWMAFASVGIQSPKLRMVLWNLNTMRFGRDWTPDFLRIWLDA